MKVALNISGTINSIMRDTANWAFWRRTQYVTALGVLLFICGLMVYQKYIYIAPTCFDGEQNGEERGMDCGGNCVRICAFDTKAPTEKWARSFKIVDGQYNAVAYIENTNKDAASPEVDYTFSLYDTEGLITERSGKTVLPPDSVYPVFEGRIQTGARVPTQTFIEIKPSDLWLPSKLGREQFLSLIHI